MALMERVGGIENLERFMLSIEKSSMLSWIGRKISVSKLKILVDEAVHMSRTVIVIDGRRRGELTPLRTRKVMLN